MGTVSPVTRPGNQAGQGRPGPDIHGWRCRKTSSLPVAFLPKSFEPSKPQVLPTSPMCLSAPCLSSQPLFDLPIPTQLSFHSSLPAVFHDFMFSWFRNFPTLQVFHKFKTSPKEAKNPSSTSAGSSWRRRLTAQPNVFQQRGNVKRNLKKIQSPKEKNTCVLKRGNPRSLSEEESPKWRLSGATSGTIVFHW